MRIKTLRTYNFKVLHSKRKHDFPDGIIGIVGPNGRGKSTLLSAVAWCLFGPEALVGGKANVITWGNDLGYVDLLIEVDGTEYTIYREQRGAGLGTAHVTSDTLLARGLDPTTRFCEQLLGVDRVGFLASVFSRQEELAGLSSLAPVNRMKTVLRLLGIDRISDAVESLRLDSRAERKELEGMRYNLEDVDEINAQIQSLNETVDDLALSISDAYTQKKDYKDQIESLLAEKNDITIKKSRQDEVERRRLKLTTGLTVTAAALEAAERALEGAPAPDPGPEPFRPDPEAQRLAEHALWDATGAAERLVKRLEGEGVCPVCERPYEDASARRAADEEQLATLEEQVKAAEKTARDFIEISSRHGRWVSAENEFKIWSETQQDFERLTQVYRRDTEALQALPQVEDVSAQWHDLYNRTQVTQSLLTEATSHFERLVEKRRSAQEALERHSHSLERAEASQDRVASLERAVLVMDVAVGELARLRETMIGKVIPTLNESASAILSLMTDGRYTELSLTPDYEIQYRNDIGELKAFENLSGGEKDIFALALRLALADLRADRLGILFLDEVLESLDSDRQQLAWQTLEQLTKRYSQIFVVTHVSDFKERASTTISL